MKNQNFFLLSIMPIQRVVFFIFLMSIHTLTLADNKLDVIGGTDVVGTNFSYVTGSYGVVNGMPVDGLDPFPGEVTATVWDLGIPDQTDFHGAWLYVNENGRVRAQVKTGVSLDRDTKYMQASLSWTAAYLRTSTDSPSFTINPSWLEVIAKRPLQYELLDRLGKESLPYAKWRFEVEIYESAVSGSKGILLHRFEHKAEISGVVDAGSTEEEMALRNVSTEQFFADLGVDVAKPIIDQIEATPVMLNGNSNKHGLRYEIPRIKQEVPLDPPILELGASYVVTYVLEVEAGEDGMESYAEAFFGDPFDTSSGGFEFTTQDTLVSSSTTRCVSQQDPNRFTNHGDGTVSDNSTGLMWQRCPIGYALDDGGTPDNLSDDTCDPNGSNIYNHDWQSALQTANTNNLADYNDWLVPDIKQLQSLVENRCETPSIDTNYFPDALPTTFMSSTTGRLPEYAMLTSFNTGDMEYNNKTSPTSLRLVRASGNTPIAPTIAINITDAEVEEEGDSGTTAMVFVAELSEASAEEIQFDFQTQHGNTIDLDLVPTQGTVTFAPGQTARDIVVNINGDTAEEPQEYFNVLLTNVVGNAYLTRDAVTGFINDDEPIVSVDNQNGEVSEGAGDFSFRIALNKPAAASAGVDYRILSGSASNSDIGISSGSVVFNPGETELLVTVPIVDDALVENDELFFIELSNRMGEIHLGEAFAAATIIDNDGRESYSGMNDTGVITCATADNSELSCPQTDFSLQDGDIGRDINNPNPSDGMLGFEFVKLDNTGVALTNQQAFYNTTPWDCVLDEVTGLYWEVKTQDTNDVRFYDFDYSWYNSSGVNVGGDSGAENGGSCVDSTNCDTEKYVAAVNAAGLCGFNDWRLPTIDQMYSLVITTASASSGYGLDINYFPDNFNVNGSFNVGYTYWTASPTVTSTDSAWQVQLRLPLPYTLSNVKSDTAKIRLVRGGQP